MVLLVAQELRLASLDHQLHMQAEAVAAVILAALMVAQADLEAAALVELTDQQSYQLMEQQIVAAAVGVAEVLQQVALSLEQMVDQVLLS
jgi:hypothetical protein